MTDDIVLIENNNIAIYKSDIDLYCQEYIDNLPESDMIYRPMIFTGMLEYIYNHCIKNLKYRDTAGLLDYDVLDNIFENIYKPLCYKYNITPKIISFCSLVRISNVNLSDIVTGSNRVYGNKKAVENVKKWYATCEAGLLEKAVECNSVGSMFALKSVYQYNDSQTIRIEQSSQEQHDSAEEIAARHAAAVLPVKPDLSE